jgi:threonine dehydrogenase-like Zn-dependent dehydrogenase
MVVIGAGIMGRMHVDIGLSYHPHTIIVSDLIADRLAYVDNLFRARAEQKGINLRLVQSGQEDLNQVIAELTNGRGADDVVVAVGAAKAIGMAQSVVGRGGVLNLFGGLPRGQEMIPLDTLSIHYREMNVTGSSGGYPWDMARTLELMACGAIDPSAHITRVGDLNHAPEFLKMVKAQTIDGKAVVYPHRKTAEILPITRWSSADEQSYLSNHEIVL